MLHGVWDLPEPGIKAVSPALAGVFFTTEPPGDLCPSVFLFVFYRLFWGLYGEFQKVRCEAEEESARARLVGSPDTVNEGGWQEGPDTGGQWWESTVFWDITQCYSIKGHKWCYSSPWKSVMNWFPQAGDSRGHVPPCQCDRQLARAGMAWPTEKTMNHRLRPLDEERTGHF